MTVQQSMEVERVAFAPEIDLWDETLREGAERSPLSPSVEEKRLLGVELAEAGLRSLVVGMFPDVPHNAELLRALVESQGAGAIDPTTKFVVISHLGVTLDQTQDALRRLEIPLGSVWLLGIHSASDQHLEHLYPVIRLKDPLDDFDAEGWAGLSTERRREENAEWLGTELQRLKGLEVGNVAVGLLDAFRSETAQLERLLERVVEAEVGHVRLVDTAGTCFPQQIDTHLRPLIERFSDVRFYGHFHNDFGLAAGNAILGLSAGLSGADVSAGGFANRAGHPALAEVAMALKLLYGIELPYLKYEELTSLSRSVERCYGLMESPTQPITGVITHGVLSGIRTQLQERAPTIFDVIDPTEVGASRNRLFGVRSGTDGMARFLSDHAKELELDTDQVATLAQPLFDSISSEWQVRSESHAEELANLTEEYHRLLTEGVAITEQEMLGLIKAQVGAAQ